MKTFARLVYYESVKTFLKKRTYVGFAIVAIVVALVEVVLTLEGGRFLDRSLRSLQQEFLFFGSLFNGWFVAKEMMNSLWVHIPLLISFVAGDQLAGEATAGTYRLILIRPVSRTRIFLAKLVTTFIYTFTFVLFLGAFSAGLGLLLFGGGDLIIFDNGILILPESSVAWRFITAYIFASWTMMTIASFALFFSSFVENAIGPIIATMGVLIVFLMVTVLPVDYFELLRPYLFTNYLGLWQKSFLDPLPWADIVTGISVLGAYSLVVTGAAWVVFVRRDVLS